MLMRSIASVYSPSRSSGITTSSLSLNALVWRAIAAVRLRSRQNALRASAPTAVKPSPERAFAMRTTCRGAACDGRVLGADDVADQHHLRQRAALRLGRVADGLQVALVEVLEAGELHAERLRLARQFVADLDDRGDRVARLAEEFEADRAHVRAACGAGPSAPT